MGRQGCLASRGVEGPRGARAVRRGCREGARPRLEVMVTRCLAFSRKPKAPESYRALLGSTQLYQHSPQTREVPVSRIITHPDFEKLHPFGSDIAMLQLLSPVNFTSYIVPACLPVPGMKLPRNSSCWITGWGMLNEESERVWGSWGGERRRRKGRRTGTKKGGVSPSEGSWDKGPLLPLCFISRGLDHSTSSSESV